MKKQILYIRFLPLVLVPVILLFVSKHPWFYTVFIYGIVVGIVILNLILGKLYSWRHQRKKAKQSIKQFIPGPGKPKHRL